MANYIGYPSGHATVYSFDTTADDIILDLDATVVSGAGKIVYVIKMDSSPNTVTVQPAPGETINGASNHVLTSQYEVLQLICTKDNQWVKVS